MNDLTQDLYAYAIIGSIVPTIFWLWFWSRRDRFCPEPKVQIFSTFVFGALAALFTLPAQSFIAALFGSVGFLAVVLFVSAEEIIKYMCGWYISMKSNPYFNERIDPIIYLSTTALGFAALENILYFLRYLNDFNLDIATIEGGKRIIGATVLHMVSACIIGIALAWSFESSKKTKAFFLVVGIILAIVVHSGFNYLVTHTNPDMTLLAFAGSWVLFMCAMVFLELLRKPTCPAEIDWNKYDI